MGSKLTIGAAARGSFSRKAVLIGADLFRTALVLSLLWARGVWVAAWAGYSST